MLKSTGKTVMPAEEGRKIELMYQSVMALPLGAMACWKRRTRWIINLLGRSWNRNFVSVPSDKIIHKFTGSWTWKPGGYWRFKPLITTTAITFRMHSTVTVMSTSLECSQRRFLVASTTIECGRYPVEIFMMGEKAKLAGQQEYHHNLRSPVWLPEYDNEWPAIKTLSLPRWAEICKWLSNHQS